MPSKRQRKKRRQKKPLTPENSALRILGFVATVSRREALVGKLDTAIWLWFFKRDPLAIHVLAMAAYQCLRDLSGVREAIVAPAYDWLRHASSDLNDRIDFKDENGRLLWDDTVLFDQLFERLTPRMRTFQAYFFHRGTWLSPHFSGNSSQLLPKGIKLGEVRYITQAQFFRKLTKGFIAEDALHVPVAKL